MQDALWSAFELNRAMMDFCPFVFHKECKTMRASIHRHMFECTANERFRKKRWLYKKTFFPPPDQFPWKRLRRNRFAVCVGVRAVVRMVSRGVSAAFLQSTKSSRETASWHADANMSFHQTDGQLWTLKTVSGPGEGLMAATSVFQWKWHFMCN